MGYIFLAEEKEINFTEYNLEMSMCDINQTKVIICVLQKRILERAPRLLQPPQGTIQTYRPAPREDDSIYLTFRTDLFNESDIVEGITEYIFLPTPPLSNPSVIEYTPDTHKLLHIQSERGFQFHPQIASFSLSENGQLNWSMLRHLIISCP